MKMKLYWYELKYVQYHYEIWNVNYSFLFGMTIMSAAINKCYQRIFVWLLHWNMTHTWLWFNNALNKNFGKYSQ